MVFHPGETLQDELDERGITQTEFAEIIDRPTRTVNEIVNGKRAVTPETAQAIAAALGTSPEMWLKMQAKDRRCSRKPGRWEFLLLKSVARS